MIVHGDCVEVMAGMEPDSIDAIVTDPPYGLEFMGKEWDRLDGAGFHAPKDEGRTFTNDSGHMYDNLKALPRFGHAAHMQQWHQRWATEALRVAKPGAYLLAFGGTRTVHRLTVALEDAGWIIRDMLVWAYACLSDDTEVLTSDGWVRYNSASEGQLAAAFDPTTGAIRWEPIEHVHRYHHEGDMVEVGPSLVTLNHRVVLDAADRVPLPGDADLRGLWGRVPDMGQVPGDTSEVVLDRVPVGSAVAGANGETQADGRPQGPAHPLRGLRDGSLEAGRMAAIGRRADMLPVVQRQAAGGGAGGGSTSRVDPGAPRGWPGAHDRPEQSRLEGRRHRVQEAWELLGRPVRALAGVGASDGTRGWLRDGAPAGDGIGLRLPDDAHRGRESREPRPVRQSTGQPDHVARQPDAQALRVGEVPAGDSEPDTVRTVPYVGTVWCITVPSGAFVARRNGVVFVTGNSGFPKSKSSLKPAHEPIVLARKPGPLQPLRIDECRIPVSDDDRLNDAVYVRSGKNNSAVYGADSREAGRWLMATVGGRWPSNLVLTDPVFDGGWDGVVGGGNAGGGYGVRGGGGDGAWNPTDRDKSPGQTIRGGGEAVGYGDTGTYSRFFLVPKASRRDREPDVPGALETTHCTCETVKLGAWENEGLSQPDQTASTSQPRAISGATSRDGFDSLMSSNGSGTSDPSHPDSMSTTSTATNKTTGSRTSRPSIPSPTNGSTLARSSSMASGGNSAPSVASSDRLTSNGGTSQPKAGPSTDDAAPAISGASSSPSVCASCGLPPLRDQEGGDAGRRGRVNVHPTQAVKPTALMRHLIRLVTPQDGTILDPFLGSGTTAKAATLEGIKWVGIEREAEYIAIAEQRLVGLVPEPVQMGLTA